MAVQLLIATDGSEHSLTAARRGFALVSHPGTVTLLTVLTEIPGDDAGGFGASVYTPDEQTNLWDAQLAQAGAELDAMAHALPNTEVHKRVEVGDVASTICRVAAEIGADAVVVGSHGRTGLACVFLGSVSEHVVRHAPCPVIVVPTRSSRDGLWGYQGVW